MVDIESRPVSVEITLFGVFFTVVLQNLFFLPSFHLSLSLTHSLIHFLPHPLPRCLPLSLSDSLPLSLTLSLLPSLPPALSEVSEAALLRDVLFVFQNIDGDFIHFDSKQEAFRIDSKVT